MIRGRVEFVVVGGFAAVAHGVTLITQDIDVCCRFTPENLMRLQEAIADTDWGQLDCLDEVLGVGSYEEVLAQSVDVPLPAGPCRILGIDALIKAKEAMKRPRDREAVLQLRAIRQRRPSPPPARP